MKYLLSHVAKDEKHVEKCLRKGYKVMCWRSKLRSITSTTKIFLCRYHSVCTIAISLGFPKASSSTVSTITVAQCVLFKAHKKRCLKWASLNTREVPAPTTGYLVLSSARCGKNSVFVEGYKNRCVTGCETST